MMNPKMVKFYLWQETVSGRKWRNESARFRIRNDDKFLSDGINCKGATVLTGYQTKAIQPGSYQLDEPIVLKGTPKNLLGRRWDLLMI